MKIYNSQKLRQTKGLASQKSCDYSNSLNLSTRDLQKELDKAKTALAVMNSKKRKFASEGS